MGRYDRLARQYRRKGLGRSPSRWALSSSGRRWRFYSLGLGALLLLIAAAGLYWSLPHRLSATPAPPVASAPQPAAARLPERTAALPPLQLPADDAAHGSATEWWYYSGILDSGAGGRYAFHMAVFVVNGLVKQTVMHAALVDLQTGKRHSRQLRTGGEPAGGAAPQAGGGDAAQQTAAPQAAQQATQQVTQQATPQPATPAAPQAARSEAGFDFRLAGWQVRGNGATHVLRADFDGAGLALDLQDSHPVVAHRAAGSATPGLLDFGPAGISYYYSRPRLAAQGWVYVDGQPTEVRGEVWFDHQWGDFDPLAVGWNWFGLQLADGSDLMLYQLFDAAGARLLTAGSLTNADGTRALAPSEIELMPGPSWTSPRTHIDYVLDWTLKLPTGEYRIKPLVADSEFDASDSSANIYWEGPVRVSGGSGVELGQGFLELSGYDRLSAAQAQRR